MLQSAAQLTFLVHTLFSVLLTEAHTLRNWRSLNNQPTQEIGVPTSNHVDSASSVLDYHRRVQLDEEDLFSTLNCNMKNDIETYAQCRRFEHEYGFDPTGEIVIPCGQCFTMMAFTDGRELSLAGLHIKGKLVIPEGINLTIKTPYVIVEGALEIKSTGMIRGEEKVKIILTGDSDVFFTPESPNTALCPPGGCNVGSRPVVVAGGKLDMIGMPQTCPSWAYSKHVSTVVEYIDASQELVDYEKTPFAFDFDDGIGSWNGNIGAQVKHVNETDIEGNFNGNSYLKVYHRKAKWQGPFFDIPLSTRESMHHDHSYIWSARVKLSRDDGKDINCVTSKTNCLSLQINRMTSEDKIAWFEKQSDIGVTAADEWTTIGGVLTYTANEISPDHIFSAITFRGPEAGVDISVDDFIFTNNDVLEAEKKSNSGISICDNLALNGDGEEYKDRKMTLPYVSWFKKEPLTLEQEADGNVYFYLKDRHVPYSSLKFDLPVACTVSGAKYQFSMKIGVESVDLVNPRVMMRITNPPGSERVLSFDLLARCAPVNAATGWVDCKSKYVFDERHENAQSIEILIVIPDDSTSSVKYDDFSFTPYSGLTLPKSTHQCWGADTDVLIAPMGDYGSEQLATIETSYQGYLTLASSINMPAPVSDKYPTEIALMSRNIAFQSDSTTSGGHLMIMKTNKPQRIEGIALKGFGQEGVKDRYPINFHMAGDSYKSQVSKNAILDSHQRCIVLSGTSRVQIKENVAYNNKGHCYVLQDGSEVDNEFNKNLGAKTVPATSIIDGESDFTPATFYITNPKNVFTENAATGSSGSGYWFHLSKVITGDSASKFMGISPAEIPLSLFDLNIAHSNSVGLQTFPGEFNPAEYSTFMRAKIFRNKEKGIYFHHSKNIIIDQSIIGDNLIGIDVDVADNIQIRNTEIEGNSGFAHPCQGFSTSRIGIQLSPNSFDQSLSGTKLSDITFRNFNDTGCDSSIATSMNEQKSRDVFDSSTLFSRLHYIDVQTKFSACEAISKGLQSLDINDSGSLNPFGNFKGHIVSNDLKDSFTFCDDLDTCSSYCYNEKVDSGGCDRIISVDVEPFGTEAVQLVVENGNETRSVEGSLVTLEDTSYRRSYKLALPQGAYSSHFIDTLGNVQVWPTFAEVKLSDPPLGCPFYLEDFNVDVGDTPLGLCDDLIQNGDFSASTDFWFHAGGGYEIINDSSGSALKTTNRGSSLEGLGQNLDTRCMIEGTQYELKAKVKMISASGESVNCDYLITGSGDKRCPRANIKASVGGEILNVDLGVGKVNVAWIPDDWNSIYGTFSVTETLLKADNVVLYFDGPSKEIDIIIQDVVIHSFSSMCNDLSLNGDFVDGTKNWGFIGPETGLKVVSGSSGNALSTVNRVHWFHGISQSFDTRCLIQDDILDARFEVTAYVKLVDSSGNGVDCDPYNYFFSAKACPHIALRVLNPDDGSVDNLRDIAFPVGPWKKDEFNLVTGSFYMSADLIYAHKGLSYFFYKSWGGKNIIVDSVSIVRKNDVIGCDDLIENGSAENGDARGWYIKGAGNVGTISIQQEGSNYFFRHSGTRSQLFNGMMQKLDNSCLQTNSRWKISFKMKLKDASGQEIACDKTLGGYVGDHKENCPEIYIQSLSSQGGGAKVTALTNEAPDEKWIAGEWNPWEATFTMTKSHKALDETWMFVHKVKLGYSYDIDDIKMVEIVE